MMKPAPLNRTILLAVLSLLCVSCSGEPKGSISKKELRVVPDNTDGVSFFWKFTGEHHKHVDEPGEFTWLVGDVNGDGKADLIRRYVNASTGPSNKVLLSNGDGTFDAVSSDAFNGANGDGKTWFFTGRFNDDDCTDLVRRHVNGGNLNKILVSNCDGTFRSVTSDAFFGINDDRFQWITGDVNGDGKTDLIRRDATGGYNKVLLSYLDGEDPRFQGYTSDSLGGGGGDGRYMYLAGTFDSNNRTDLVRRDRLGQYNKVLLANSDGKTFSVFPLPDDEGGINGDGNFFWFTGDFNNDGRTDLVRRSANGQANRLLIAAANGKSFSVIDHPDTFGGINGDGESEWFVADVNGDGKDDLIRRQANGLLNKVLLANSAGNGFDGTSPGDLLGFHEVDDHLTSPEAEEFQWYVGDFTGDGLPDMARRAKAGKAAVEDSTQIEARNLVLINNYEHRYNQYHIARTLFAGGEGGFHSFRIPALVRTPSGRLLAFAEGRRNNMRDHENDIDLVLKTSDDDGRTWHRPGGIGDPLRIVGTTNGERAQNAEDDGGWYLSEVRRWDGSVQPEPDPQGVVGNPTPVVDEETGRIWLFFIYTHSDDDSEWKPGARQIYTTYSDDDGDSWELPERREELMMNEEEEGTNWEVLKMAVPQDNIGPGGGIQASNGWLIIPAFQRHIYSQDHGATWAFTRTRNHQQGHETAVVEAPDGSFLRSDRAIPVRRFGKFASPDQSQSEGWTPLHQPDAGAWYYDPHFPDPLCQASILRLPAVQPTFVFLNPGTSVNRYQMIARLSTTFSVPAGSTFPQLNWEYSRPLDYRKGGYSSLAPCGDYVCSMHEWDRRGNRESNGGSPNAPWSIVFSRFNLAWLKDEALALRGE